MGQRHQHMRGAPIEAALVRDDPGFLLGRREIEVQRDKALASAGFEVLEQMLIARIVGHHQLEPLRGFEQFAGLVDRQQAAMIGQRMNDYDRVLAASTTSSR